MKQYHLWQKYTCRHWKRNVWFGSKSCWSWEDQQMQSASFQHAVRSAGCTYTDHHKTRGEQVRAMLQLELKGCSWPTSSQVKCDGQNQDSVWPNNGKPETSVPTSDRAVTTVGWVPLQANIQNCSRTRGSSLCVLTSMMLGTPTVTVDGHFFDAKLSIWGCHLPSASTVVRAVFIQSHANSKKYITELFPGCMYLFCLISLPYSILNWFFCIQVLFVCSMEEL